MLTFLFIFFLCLTLIFIIIALACEDDDREAGCGLSIFAGFITVILGILVIITRDSNDGSEPEQETVKNVIVYDTIKETIVVTDTVKLAIPDTVICIKHDTVYIEKKKTAVWYDTIRLGKRW